jgi:transmembrane sensor
MKDSSENTVSVPLLEEAADWMDRQAELTDAERGVFHAWLAASPARARAYDMMRHAMLDSALLEASEDVRMAPVPRILNTRLLGWAAAGLAVAATILVMLFTRAPMPAPAAMPAVARDYATGLRQRADWRLADNSHLFLNADSKIGVQYLAAERNLSLARGEAIFEVAKDPARPFHVMAHAVTVTAVGTMFGVDLMNDAVGVRVYHGVVTVARANEKTLTLRKGDWLTLDPRMGMQGGHFDPETYQNWRTGWLEADKMRLSYVVAKLNRYSDLPIVIGDDALANAVLTGRFHLSNVDTTLQLIAVTLNLAPVRRGGRIYLVAQHG